MAQAVAAPAETGTIVLDLGAKRRKQIKRLKRGRGRLFERVETTIGQLRSDGEIAEGAQVVVVVVKQKPELGLGRFGF